MVNIPIPKPKTGEKQEDFISRCMGDKTMNKEYPDQKQRNAVCSSTWRKSKESKETKRLDEDGHIIVAENVPIIFDAEVMPVSSVEVD